MEHTNLAFLSQHLFFTCMHNVDFWPPVIDSA